MKAKLFVAIAIALSPMLWQMGKAADQVKACDLLTKQEVEEIIGEKIDTVEVQAGYGNCLYHRKVNIFGEVMRVPAVTVGYSRSDVKSRWHYWFSKPTKEVIPGIGEGAVWSPEDAFLVCRIKGGLLMIAIWGEVDAGSKSERKDLAVKLAKKAIGRIKP